MEYKQAKSVISKLSDQIRVISITAAALIFCNALLGALLWHQSGKKTIVLIPSTLKEKAVLTENSVSSSYLESMAMMLINDRLNITPENISASNANLLIFVDPDYYSAFKNKLSLESKTIVDSKISSSFYIDNIKTTANDLIVDVSGHLKRWVGERLISSEEKSYELKFSMRGYQLLLTSFVEINNSGDNKS